MKLRVAMIGCGAVGSIHAANLAKHPEVELAAVYSPDYESASSFASAHHIPKVADSLGSACAEADVAIVCSPSAVHFEQARECLKAGLHTLIELPACGSLQEAEELQAEAGQSGVLLGCAHTARYLQPYAKIQLALDAGWIGEIQAINYVRCPRLNVRSWTDNALVHHAAHALDLATRWCGEIEPLACIAAPDKDSAQTASILARLPSGGPLSVTVSYKAQMPDSSMLIIGDRCTIRTDGFSYLQSDLHELQFSGDEHKVYVDAIGSQDADFIGACQGKNSFVPWAETMRLIRLVCEVQALSTLPATEGAKVEENGELPQTARHVRR
ncbi:MAG TPA: Gfo/Idh/MocA family oxidoreductase [Edaphobacter sp.]|jgi:2-hydroxy-4-carboxymuconate semialdehyde hemiacetal dehydrogenase|nr:Gfo/Idh/MocA family oxidoreductase [Edaphobacter sp.]